MDRALTCSMTNAFHGPTLGLRAPGPVVDEVLDEGQRGPTLPSMCVPSSGSSAMTIVPAGVTRPPRARSGRRIVNASVDGREIVPVLIESGANSVEIAKRRKELERARQQAFTLKQLQQPPGAGLEEALAHRWQSRPRRRRSAAPRTPRG